MLTIAPTYASDAQQPAGNEKVIFPEQAAVISESDIPKFQRDALEGSSDAAHRLATYYGMIKFDFKQQIYWTEIRFEDGDRDARYDLGAYLADDDNPLSRVRARYWLKQVQKDGPPKLVELAGYVLQGLDEREKRVAP